MALSTKQSWLEGPGDLKEGVVEDVPVKGQSVKIRALSATSANAGNAAAITTQEVRGQQVVKVDNVRLDILRFVEGVVEPKFTEEEARILSAKYGPAWHKTVKAIVELSGIDDQTASETEARFQGGGTQPAGTNGDGTPEGNAGPAQPLRAGAGTRDER